MEPFDPYARIGRPAEAHNVLTPEAYLDYQARIIAHNKQALPTRRWRDPFLAVGVVVAPLVNAGRWIVMCPSCGNGPIYDPEWQLACCCECGAIFDDVVPPAEWQAIEAALIVRPLVNRRWQPGETVADLLADNRVHGLDPVGGPA